MTRRECCRHHNFYTTNSYFRTPSVIDESCVIKLNSDYENDSTEHHLNDAFVIRREITKNSPASTAIVCTLKTSIDTTLSPCLEASGKEVSHSRKNVESRVKRNIKRLFLSRSKKPPTDGLRLSDKEFDGLHRIHKFTVEGCCDSLGLNCHEGLPFYSKENSLLDHNVTRQYVYRNPPWSLVVQCVEHLRACHSRSPLDTKTVIGLLDWPKFKTITKELKLIKQLPKGESVFMRISPTCTYVPSNLLPSIWHVNFWLIDANTPILSPLLTTNVNNLKPNNVKIESELDTAAKIVDEKLSTTSALVIMNPYEAEALMRFIAVVSYTCLTSEANTLIETSN